MESAIECPAEGVVEGAGVGVRGDGEAGDCGVGLRLVVGDEGGGVVVEDGELSGDGVVVVVGAVGVVEGGAASAAGDSLADGFLVGVEDDDVFDADAVLGEGLGLGDVAGKAVQDEALVPRVEAGAVEEGVEEACGEVEALVGEEGVGVEEVLDDRAVGFGEVAVACGGGAEFGSEVEVAEGAVLLEEGALGAFAGAGGSEEEDGADGGMGRIGRGWHFLFFGSPVFLLVPKVLLGDVSLEGPPSISFLLHAVKQELGNEHRAG